MDTILHIIADGYNARRKTLGNVRLLDTYVKNINPHAFSHIISYTDPRDEEMNGVTGILLAPGLHTTVHTYNHPAKACYFYDFFNYNPLIHEQSRSILESSYQPTLYTSSYSRRDTALRTFEAQKAPLEYYGPHLMVRAAADPHLCQRAAFLMEDFLWKLPQLIGMHPLTKPYLVESETWLSSIRVIAESHISVHLEKLTGNLYIDIFSCKNFEEHKVIEHIKETFACTLQDCTLLYRGTHFHGTAPSIPNVKHEKVSA